MGIRPGCHCQTAGTAEFRTVDGLGIALGKELLLPAVHLQIVAAPVIEQRFGAVAGAVHIVEVVADLPHLPSVGVIVQHPVLSDDRQIPSGILQAHHIRPGDLHREAVAGQIHRQEAVDVLDVGSAEKALDTADNQPGTQQDAQEDPQTLPGAPAAALLPELPQIGDIFSSVVLRSAHSTPYPDTTRRAEPFRRLGHGFCSEQWPGSLRAYRGSSPCLLPAVFPP